MKKLLLLISILLIEQIHGQVQLCGITQLGGTNFNGCIFNYTPSTSVYIDKFDFLNANGGAPAGGIVQASDSKIYGLTQNGGTFGIGVLFQYDPSTSIYINKFNFDTVNGSSPQGALIQATNGKLYGMTYDGGIYGFGVLFEYDPSTSIYTKKYDFDNTNGSKPMGSLVQATNGKLYGLTYQGGTNGQGVLFQYDPSASIYTKKYDFNYNTSGSSPMGSLIQATNGKLYGVTYNGGVNGDGVLFQYDPSTSVYTKKFDFSGSTSGRYIASSLMQASDGNLYGMSIQGGANNFGVIYQFNPSTSVYTKKIDFNGTVNGANPYGALMQASDGMLYGMTYSGGTNNGGTLFQYDPTNSICNKKIDFIGNNGWGPYFNNLIEVNPSNSVTTFKSNANQIYFYPNPTSDQFFVEANTTDKLTVDLYDVNGRHVFSTSVSDKSNINIATLNEGIYTMAIKTVDRVTNKKLVIVR